MSKEHLVRDDITSERSELLMTTKEVIALAKGKLGRDITEKEAQDYLNGKAAIPDEALAIAAGGAKCESPTQSPQNGSNNGTGNIVKTWATNAN